MDCGVEGRGSGAKGAMLNVPPGADGAQPPNLTTAVYAPPESDQAQFEADKRAVYKHPLFPLLALLFERCELATQSSDAQSSDAFNLDIQAFVQHQERDRKPFLANEPEIDGLMIKAIQVLRIHLLELEKVQELCKDFCNRYITCLKGKMQSENLLRSDYTQGPGVMSALENNNNMLSHGNSESGSNSNSPVQYTISPTQQGAVHPGGGDMDSRSGLLAQDSASEALGFHVPVGPPLSLSAAGGGGSITPTPFAGLNNSGGCVNSSLPLPSVASNTPTGVNGSSPGGGMPGGALGVVTAQMGVASSNGAGYDPHVVHGSTPLGQIGVSVCPAPVEAAIMAGQLSPAPTTPGGSADDCDSDFTGRVGSKKQKRGVLPKHATSVMRSWLFQHLVHPYPTEDEKRHIAAQTNLTLLQVNNWFINARRRILQPMLDAGTPPVSGEGPNSTLGSHGKHAPSRKRPHHNGGTNKRFWPQDIASLQPQLNSGVLSSSEDDCDSYSSDDNEGGLIIDTPRGMMGVGGAPSASGGGSNGHNASSDTPTYSPDSDHP